MSWLKEARPNQLPPDGDWQTWMLKAGRGYGKTRAGAEWLKWEMLQNPHSRWAIVAPTSSDARNTCMEGESGLLSIMPYELIVDWKRSYQEMTLTLKNGSMCKCYTASEPDRMRGPQYWGAWCDELSSWAREDAWDMLLMGLRLGPHPKRVVTTTPKPNKLTQRILNDPATVTTSGSTFDNAANLPESFLKELRDKYEGTRMGRQELYAELLTDVPGALWTLESIARAHEKPTPPAEHLRRIVVAIDPSGSDGTSGDSQGIVVAGIDRFKNAHVLADESIRGSPEQWASHLVSLFDKWRADKIVAEKNYGGDMVRATIELAVQRKLPISLINASRGKHVRAEPVSMLYEQGKVSHLTPFPKLEQQMTEMTSNGFVGQGSPDRVDALVWALTELMFGRGSAGGPSKVKVKTW